MSSWNTGDTVVNGVRLHSIRTGGTKPPVVLVHGFSDSGLCWTPVAQALEANYDIVMVDARGHGFSDAPETGYTLTEMASDLQGVIASLGLVRPAMIGHSMGGELPLRLLACTQTCPEQSFWKMLERSTTQIFRTGRRAERTHSRRGFRGFKPRPATSCSPRCGHRRNGRMPSCSRGLMRSFSSTCAPHNSTTGITWAELLPRVTCPALLLTADLDRGAIVRPEMAAAMQQQMPQLQIAHIPGAGHSIRREQFDRYIAVVRSFLDTWAAAYRQADAHPFVADQRMRSRPDLFQERPRKASMKAVYSIKSD